MSWSWPRECLYIKVPVFLSHCGSLVVDFDCNGTKITGNISWNRSAESAPCALRTPSTAGLYRVPTSIDHPFGTAPYSTTTVRHVTDSQNALYDVWAPSESTPSIGRYDIRLCKPTIPAVPDAACRAASSPAVSSQPQAAPSPAPSNVSSASSATSSIQSRASTAATGTSSTITRLANAAPIPGQSAQETCILVDFSNVLVTAKQLIRDQLRQPSIDVNPIFWDAFDTVKFIRYVEGIESSAKIGERYLATGSTNLNLEAMYEFESNYYDLFLPPHILLKMHGCVIGRREQGVDANLLQHGNTCLHNGGGAYTRKPTNHLRFIFVTGDASHDEEAGSSFADLGQKALQRGWDIAVISFKSSLSSEWRRMKERIDRLSLEEQQKWGRMSIHHLDDEWHRVCSWN